LRKRKGITIKIPRSKLENGDVYEKVTEHLRKNPKDAYTIGGLIVELFGANPKDLNAPFKDWPKGMPSLYTRIRLALERLKTEKLVDSKKHGRAFFYFWHESD